MGMFFSFGEKHPYSSGHHLDAPVQAMALLVKKVRYAGRKKKSALPVLSLVPYFVF
jgi:hypothetical protein